MARAHVIRALVLLGSVALGAGEALATAQAADVIVLAGKEHLLLVNPLKAYFQQNPERRPRREVMSSCNWRGYIAYFAIVSDELHVLDVRIESRENGQYRSVFSQVFPVEPGARATWFTGHLIIAEGKRTKYVHSGYDSEYERYIVIRVKAGKAGATRRLDTQEFEAFKRSQLEAWQQTDEYRKHLETTQQAGAGFERFSVRSADDYLVRIFD